MVKTVYNDEEPDCNHLVIYRGENLAGLGRNKEFHFKSLICHGDKIKTNSLNFPYGYEI